MKVNISGVHVFSSHFPGLILESDASGAGVGGRTSVICSVVQSCAKESRWRWGAVVKAGAGFEPFVANDTVCVNINILAPVSHDMYHV